MNIDEFNKFCKQVDPDEQVTTDGTNLAFTNRSGNTFRVFLNEVDSVLLEWKEKNDQIAQFILSHEGKTNDNPWHYQEKPYRDVFNHFFNKPELNAIYQQARSQTRGLMFAISKYVGYKIHNQSCSTTAPLLLDTDSLNAFFNPQDTLVTESPSVYPGLKEAFTSVCAFCEIYDKHEGPYLSTDPEVKKVLEPINVISQWAERHFGLFLGVALEVRASKGVGKFPRVPWICILPPGQSVNKGIYVAICFGKEGAGAIVGCAQSVSNPQSLKVVIRSRMRPLKIDVDGTSAQTHYNDAFNNPLEFTPTNFDEQALRNHIDASLRLCFDHIGINPKTKLEGKNLSEFYPRIIDSFADAVAGAGFQFNRKQIRSFVCSLISKPFVILTGNAGTGKTKLAILFSRWLSAGVQGGSELIPVGADWTDNRNIVGFLNLLRKDEGTPVYQSTPALDLLLRAEKEEQVRPFFLILDEMNLSHVERYFADILSAMESGIPIPLYQEDIELDIHTSSGFRLENGSVRISKNVFIVGTVNIDETTYMFSPKVLDRANVIESRLSETEVNEFLNKQTPVKDIGKAPSEVADAFLELSLRARGYKEQSIDAPEAFNNCTVTLGNLFKILQRHRVEFAFRTITEVLRYVKVDYALTSDKPTWRWQECIDACILQKILPKLHGSRKRIEPVLLDLARFCEKGTLHAENITYVSDFGASPNIKRVSRQNSDVDATVIDSVFFRESYEKICDMLDIVRRDQFVSFIQ